MSSTLENAVNDAKCCIHWYFTFNFFKNRFLNWRISAILVSYIMFFLKISKFFDIFAYLSLFEHQLSTMFDRETANILKVNLTFFIDLVNFLCVKLLKMTSEVRFNLWKSESCYINDGWRILNNLDSIFDTSICPVCFWVILINKNI